VGDHGFLEGGPVTDKGQDEMEFASLEVPWGDEARAKRVARIRWGVVIVYVVLVTVLALFPLVSPELDAEWFAILYIGLVVGGAIVLLLVLSMPYLQAGRGGAATREGLVGEEGVARRLRPGETFYVRVRFDLILYIMVPVIILMAVMLVTIPEREAQAIIGVVVAAMTIVTLVFINLDVRADIETLSFKFTAFGKEIPIDDISSIAVTEVHALRDYMGYGVRLGPDGTMGYVLRGGPGFRVETVKGKAYVVTIPQPEVLVEYVRAAKAERARER